VFTLMIIGAVVNGMLVSSVIRTIMSTDPATADFKKKKRAIYAFAEHAKLDQSTLLKLRMWITEQHQYSSGYDVNGMRQMLIDGGGIPRYLLGILPSALFNGQLACNNFIAMCRKASARLEVPPRLPLLMALQLSEHRFVCGEIVYYAFDMGLSLHLVMGGTFAHVARASPNGGVAAVDWMRSPHFPTEGADRTSITDAGPTCKVMTLCPYELISARSYCGDVELFNNRTRHSTLRCETEMGGITLVMSKPDLMLLAQDFPHYAAQWKAEAKRRAWSQEQRFQRLTSRRCYAELAAVCIQRYVRDYQLQQQQLHSQFRKSLDDVIKVVSAGSSDMLDVLTSADELHSWLNGSSDVFDLESGPVTMNTTTAARPELRQNLIDPALSQLRANVSDVGLSQSSYHDGVNGDCEVNGAVQDLCAAVQVQGKQLQAALDGIAKLLDHRRCMEAH